MTQMPSSRTDLAVLYLLVQAASVAAWWLLLWLVPSTRAPFVVGADWPESTLLAFALPDLVVIVVGSVAAAVGLRRHAAWAHPVLWFVAGGVGYATLWCLGGNLATGSGGLSSALMLASSLGTGWTLFATRR
jgi:hypothetical protein